MRREVRKASAWGLLSTVILAALIILGSRNLARHRGDPLQGLAAYEAERRPRASRVVLQAREQFQNNRKNPAPPPLSRDWIFAHDATVDPVPVD